MRDLDEVAERRYEAAGLDPDRPNIAKLVHVLLGCAIERGPRPVHGPAALYRIGTQYRIIVSSKLPPAYQRFYAAHELAHWMLRAEGLDDRDEAAADYLGAALLAPRRAFLSAVRCGLGLPDLADEFGLTETGAALRLGETTHRPIVLVAPSSVRRRGPEEWVWPPDRTLRSWARTGRPGLARVRLVDDPRRVMLEADETAPQSA